MFNVIPYNSSYRMICKMKLLIFIICWLLSIVSYITAFDIHKVMLGTQALILWSLVQSSSLSWSYELSFAFRLLLGGMASFVRIFLTWIWPPNCISYFRRSCTLLQSFSTLLLYFDSSVVIRYKSITAYLANNISNSYNWQIQPIIQKY